MKMYGIKNCDTVRKAQNFLKENSIPYDFHDYKKTPPTEELLKQWAEKIGLEVIINKSGTTYRKLSEKQKESMESLNLAIKILIENPSIIKRPILLYENKYVVGFNKDNYNKLVKINCGT